jgi:deoxyribonuclease IV
VILGAHVDRSTVLTAAQMTGSQAVQIFLAAPRTWTAPKPRGDEESIRTSGLLVYAHAPYLVNPASLNPDVRTKSRRTILEHSHAAQAVGALGLVVHGGHPTGTGTIDDGLAGWLEVLEGAELPVPILIENTAGGNAAVARRFDAFARLYDALSSAGHHVGVCLDTCHAHAGGEELVTACERLIAFAGRIDLVHANDSRDVFDSGRDRHANLGDGFCGLDAIANVVAKAGCPAVVETPGGVDAMRADVDALRSHRAHL